MKSEETSPGHVFAQGVQRLSLQVAALVLLTLVALLIPLAWAVDSLVSERLVRNALEDVRSRHKIWMQKLQHDLEAAEFSIQRFAHLLDSGLSARPAYTDADFERWVARDPDGMWRSRRDLFDPARHAGLWAPDSAIAGAGQRGYFMRLLELTQAYGLGAAGHLNANTWVLPRENGEVVFWPGSPDFIYQTLPDQDYRPTDWVRLTEPERNPAGEPRWTGTSFDPVPKVWMISVVAPFHRDGQWSGAVGHDVVVDDLFAILSAFTPSDHSEVLVLDRDQRVLISSRHQAEVETADNTLTLSQLDDATLVNQVNRAWQKAYASSPPMPVLLQDSSDVIMAWPLMRPEWLVVTIAPCHTALALVAEPLRWLRWGIAVAMLLLLAACSFLIRYDTVGRMRAMRELRSSLTLVQSYEAHLNRSPAVVVVWQAAPEWPVQFISDNISQFGYSADDLRSGHLPWARLLPPDEWARCTAEMDEHWKHGRLDVVLNFRLLTTGGQTRWIEARILMLRAGKRRLASVQAILLDITDRHRAEQALHTEQMRYLTLFKNAGVGIAYFNQAARLELINDCGGRMWQRSFEFLQGRDVEQFMPLEMAAAVRERIQSCIASGKTTAYEDLLELQDGPHWFTSLYTYIHDWTGQPGVQVVSHDISDRKRAEQALQQSEERYRTMVETAQEGVWAIDQDARTTFVNQRMADLLGYTVEEMMGKPLFAFMDEDGIRRAQMNFDRRRQGIKESHDFRFRRKDGSDLWAIVSTNPLVDERGRFAGSLGLITDITERRHHEEQRRHIEQRIEQAQRMEGLGILAAGIAHDFNNLLQAIEGHAELALQDAGEQDSLREYLGEIQKAVKRAGQISGQMLAYIGQSGRSRVRIDLGEQVRNLQNAMEIQANGQARLEIGVIGDIPPIAADPMELQQAILHLFTNALESRAERQVVHIQMCVEYRTWSQAEVQELFGAPELPSGPYVSLTIRDDGCGIDRANMNHLFEPFFSTKFPGRGLSLMSVLGFVRGLGGGIKVITHPGQGTTFALVIPESIEASPEPRLEPAPWTWRGSGTLLLVDDEASVLNAGRRLLSDLGFEVLTAGEGQEALSILRARPTDIRCVILDLVMPRMDGAETLSAIRILNPDLPVIIATAYPAVKVQDTLGGLTFQGAVHKPYRSAELARILHGLFG